MTTRTKYIFCSSANREDTFALFLMFSLINEAHVVLIKDHSDQLLERINLYNRYKFDKIEPFFKDVKIPGINEILSHKRKDTYIEIDPTFIYSSARVLCDHLGKDMSVVHFIRNIVDSSIVMCMNKTVPSFKYKHHALNLRYSANRIKPVFIKYREFRHSFFRALWHNLECYVRTKDLISMYPNIDHKIFFSKWMDDRVEIKNLMKFMNIKINRKKLESASKIKKNCYEISNHRNGNSLVYKNMGMKEWTRVALRFINRFGNSFQITKEECVQLTEI